MELDWGSLRQLRDEATDRFVGHDGVIGVGISRENRLTILVSESNARQEEAIRNWAGGHSVAVDVIVAGVFRAAAIL